jgi:hypothetical protein
VVIKIDRHVFRLSILPAERERGGVEVPRTRPVRPHLALHPMCRPGSKSGAVYVFGEDETWARQQAAPQDFRAPHEIKTNEMILRA